MAVGAHRPGRGIKRAFETAVLMAIVWISIVVIVWLAG